MKQKNVFNIDNSGIVEAFSSMKKKKKNPQISHRKFACMQIAGLPNIRCPRVLSASLVEFVLGITLHVL